MVLIELLKDLKWGLINWRNRRMIDMSEEEYREKLGRWFEKCHGYKMDFDNPKTFNEKLQWLKLYDSTALKSKLADKLLVRDFVEQTIGGQYLIPLLGHYDKVSDINFEELPESFVIKTNNASQTVLIVKDKKKLNLFETRLNLNRWLALNFAYVKGFELHYGAIPPKIVIEKYMGDNLNDYKIYCFNGVPEFISIDTARYLGHKRAFYDMNWKPLPFKYSVYPTSEVEKPKSFELMVELARKLSEQFCFVRVDFYEIDGKPYFGEMTFTCSSGSRRFDPPEFDLICGEKITLPAKSPLPIAAIKKVWCK